MFNYIPENYYEKNLDFVYGSKKDCLKNEGSAIEVDLSEIDLKNCKIEDGKVVECTEKFQSNYNKHRKKEYPDIGDQLDAIWKHLNYRRLNGENLVQDCDDILGLILSIKAKYPKPE